MSGDRWEDRDEPARRVNRERNFWTPLYRFGKLCTIQFERVEANGQDDDDCCEYFSKKMNNVTGSGDRNRVQLLSDEAEDTSKQKRKFKRQRCRRHHWPARRHRHEAEDDGSEGRPQTFKNWRSRRENLPGYLQQVPDDEFEEFEIDERGRPVEEFDGDDGPEFEGEEPEDVVENEEPFDDEGPVRDRSEGNQGVCTCPPGVFTKKNFDLQWNKLRSLVGRCYPALPCRDEDYYLFPKCPTTEDGCKRENHRRESSRLIDPDHYPEDDGGPSSEQEAPTSHYGVPTSGSGARSLDSEATTSDSGGTTSDSGATSSDSGATTSDPDASSPKFYAPPSARKTDSTSPTSVDSLSDTIICYTPPFWAKFFQIVILAPLFAFTAYLFYEWFIATRAYNKKSALLKRLKSRNEALLSESSRLEAYLMSAQMSPLVNGKSQAKAKEEAARISQSLNSHKLKMRQLEEERSVLMEVLFNLRRPEEDRGDRRPPLPIFTNFNRFPS